MEGGGAGEAEERGGERRKDDGEEARRREAAEAGRQLLEAEAARKVALIPVQLDPRLRLSLSASQLLRDVGMRGS